MTEPEVDIDDNDSDVDYKEFFFESDHLALRGNADYTSVLRTIAILQTQRIQVTRDIDRLATAEKEALDDPEEFVKQLVAGKLNMPGAVTAAEVSSVYFGSFNVLLELNRMFFFQLPKINFEKYGVAIPEFVEDEPKAAEAADMTVRGRLFDQTKPETFNQLWTCDEQKRLEELLIEYPPEPVEMRRFAKIARALGNRTKRQVASRLQKYFKKLHSAGMPVPGRIPKSHRVNTARLARINKQALRPTTFFPANHVPFAITEDDYGGISLDSNWYRQGCSAISENSNSNDAGTNSRRTYIVDDGDSDSTDAKEQPQEVLMLRLLERLKLDKEKDNKADRHYCEHIGYKVRCGGQGQWSFKSYNFYGFTSVTFAQMNQSLAPAGTVQFAAVR